jgi:hypothetical protein
VLGSGGSFSTDTFVQFEQVENRDSSYQDNSVVHTAEMSDNFGPSIDVLCDCSILHDVDHRVNLHFQRRRGVPVSWQPLCVYRLGRGCKEKSHILSVWTILVFYLL